MMRNSRILITAVAGLLLSACTISPFRPKAFLDLEADPNPTPIEVPFGQSGTFTLTHIAEDVLQLVDLSQADPISSGRGATIHAVVLTNRYLNSYSGDTIVMALKTPDERAAFHLIDISDPNGAIQLGSFPMADTTDHEPIGLYRGFLYVHVSSPGNFDSETLNIYDLRSLTNMGDIEDLSPYLVSSTRLGFSNFDHLMTVFTGDYLYLAGDNSSDLYILNIADPSSPDLRGNVYVQYITHMQREGDRLYLHENQEFLTLDINDPERPIPLGSFTIFSRRTFGIHNGYLYVNQGNLLEIYSLEEPRQGELVHQVEFPNNSSAEQSWFNFVGDRIYLTLLSNAFIHQRGVVFANNHP